jgi:hypothetical protein
MADKKKPKGTKDGLKFNLTDILPGIFAGRLIKTADEKVKKATPKGK